jgi:hypothetical protein
MQQLHVFDFDGTLVDSSHRYRLDSVTGRIDLDHWRENSPLAYLDTPLPLVRKFRALKAEGHVCVIATARVWCVNAEKLCILNGIEYDALVARNGENDSRGGVELKLSGIMPLFESQLFESVHVYEDNLDYLNGLCEALDAVPHFVPSNQGY